MIDLVEAGRVAGLGIVLGQVAEQPVQLQPARHSLEAEIVEVPAVVQLEVDAGGPDRRVVLEDDRRHVFLAVARDTLNQRTGR